MEPQTWNRADLCHCSVAPAAVSGGGRRLIRYPIHSSEWRKSVAPFVRRCPGNFDT